jgi:ABC-type multidrug transport system ATPase subunit
VNSTTSATSAAPEDQRIVSVENAGVKLGDTQILTEVDLVLARGEIVFVYGANGAGKSTLLRLLAGEVRPTEGKVDIAPGLRSALMGDTPVLYDVLTPPEHLTFFSRFWKEDIDITSVLRRFDLEHLAKSYGRELSLGERQRLSMALLMVGRPDLVLLDEPFNGLDRATSQLLRDTVRDIVAAGGTVVIVTHAVEQVRDLAPRLIVLDRGHLAHDDAVHPGQGLQRQVFGVSQ